MTMTDDDDEERRATRTKGKLKEVVGQATGDRHVEAVGRVEAETGHEPDQQEEREAEKQVRRNHGDIRDSDDGKRD